MRVRREPERQNCLTTALLKSGRGTGAAHLRLRINTDYSHHHYDILLLIDGVPGVRIEPKTLGNPRRAMEHIVEYTNDPGSGYTQRLVFRVVQRPKSSVRSTRV